MRQNKLVPTAEIRLDPLRNRTVAVLGFGNQGAANAMNLRDSGLRVIVGQRPGAGQARAQAEGFTCRSPLEATREADLVIFGLPDERVPELFEAEIRPALRAGQAIGFLHGLCIHAGWIRPPADVDVVLLAPKAQGRAVRSAYLAGRGVLALVAIEQDATGTARQTALAWAAGIGCGRAAVLETTFTEETEADLFGEQAVLCGGLSALVQAGFETLTRAGFPAELAYLECCHEVKLIADLIYEHGIAGMRQRISSTARYGDLSRGPRVIDERVRQAMERILSEIQSGQFADELRDAARRAVLRAAENAEMEAIGRRLRQLAGLEP